MCAASCEVLLLSPLSLTIPEDSRWSDRIGGRFLLPWSHRGDCQTFGDADGDWQTRYTQL